LRTGPRQWCGDQRSVSVGKTEEKGARRLIKSRSPHAGLDFVLTRFSHANRCLPRSKALWLYQGLELSGRRTVSVDQDRHCPAPYAPSAEPPGPRSLPASRLTSQALSNLQACLTSKPCPTSKPSLTYERRLTPRYPAGNARQRASLCRRPAQYSLSHSGA